MSIIHSFKDHVFGFKMTTKPLSYFVFDVATNYYLNTCWKMLGLIREKHIELAYIRLDGMKHKYHNNLICY